MEAKVNILLGVSGENAVEIISILEKSACLHFNIETVDVKDKLAEKISKNTFHVLITNLQFLKNCYPDFLKESQYSSIVKIVLIDSNESKDAIGIIENEVDEWLIMATLTTEIFEKSILTSLNKKKLVLTKNNTQSSVFATEEINEKMKDKNLQKFYERFIRISSTTNDAVWEWNLKDNSLWANDNHQLLYGLRVSDPVPTKDMWVERIHPDDRQRLLDMQENALASDTNVFISEYRFLTGGDYKYIFDRCYIERDESGNPVLMTGSMMDITERKIAEEKIIHSNERFELIARTTNEALWEMDLVTGYTWSNETHQQLYGLTLQDKAPLFEQWEASIHPEDRDTVMKSFDAVFNSNDNVWVSEYRLINFKGEEIAIYDRTYIVRNGQGKPIRMMGSMMDITERKKANEALIKSEEKYRTLVEQATDAIFIADEKGKFIVVNPAAVKLSKYNEEELLQMTIYHLSDPEEVKLKPFAFAEMKSERGASSERKMRCKDGTLVDIEINAKFLSDGRFLAFIRDITERKKAENELNNSYEAIRKLTSHLQDAREDERKHIARNIHDELGQLLTVLKMDISWLNKKIKALNVPAITQKSDEVLELLNNTVQSVRRIAADLRPGLLDDLGLTAAIEWHLGEFGKRTGIQTFFNSQIQSNLPVEKATSLFRIYQESMTNVARHANASIVSVALKEDDRCLIMQISDNGRGFDIGMVSKRKTLGLLGMKERAEMMGGSFDISKNKDGGTQVEVKLQIDSNEFFENK